MATKTDIANMAISHLGVGTEIADVETERSNEALACRRFFDSAVDTTLRGFAWPFATRIAALALVESTPNDEWQYSYRYPSDCASIRRILSGSRMDARETRVPYRIASDSEGKLIYTDKQNAKLEYTLRLDETNLYPPDCALAISFLLAYLIAPRLTGQDPFKMGDRAYRSYLIEIRKAEAQNANEEQPDMLPEAESVRARDS